MEEKKQPLIKHVDEKTIHVLKNAIVPENNVFNVYDHEGILIKRINSGGLNDLEPMDCFLIDCPSTFPPGTRCWRCQLQPAKFAD